MAQNGTIAYVTEKPECDFCKIITERTKRPGMTVEVMPASYDFRTKDGRWANGCYVHWRMHRMHDSLGVGMGQRLAIYAPTPGQATKQ